MYNNYLLERVGMHHLTIICLLSLLPVKGPSLADGVESLEHGGHDLSDDHTCCVVDAGVT